MATRPTPDERTIVRGPAGARTFTRWTTDDLEVAEAITAGGSLWRAADLCWALLGDGRVWAALETRVRGLLRLPMSWDRSGDGRSSGRVARALEEGDWYASHSEAALFSLFSWGILLGVGLAQRVWQIAPSGRWIGVLKPYDARNLRWDTQRRVWMVRTETGEVEIRKGDRRWVLYTPYCSGDPDGDERPWMYGAWRRCGRPWLLKLLAFTDFGHHSEMHGSPIRTADYDAAAAGTGGVKTGVVGGAGKTTRDDLGDKLADLGGDAAIIPPAGYKIRLVEAVANTWKMFPAESDMAAREIVIGITGQSSSTEIVQGQDTGATLHGIVRQDLIEGDEQTGSTCLHDQDLVDYAAVNFGTDELAPWPRWATEPPVDIGARGDAMKKLGDGLAALAAQVPEGKALDRMKILEDAGVPLIDAAQPEPLPLVVSPPDETSAPPPDAP